MLVIFQKQSQTVHVTSIISSILGLNVYINLEAGKTYFIIRQLIFHLCLISMHTVDHIDTNHRQWLYLSTLLFTNNHRMGLYLTTLPISFIVMT